MRSDQRRQSENTQEFEARLGGRGDLIDVLLFQRTLLVLGRIVRACVGEEVRASSCQFG